MGTQYETIFSSKTESTDEKVSLNDIDDMIQNLAKKIAEKRLQDLEKPDLAIIEEDQEEEADLKDKESTDVFVESDRCLDATVGNALINEASADTLKQPFDYEAWKSSMDKMFSSKTEEPLKRNSSDEKYLQSLKEKIKTNIEKSKKNFKDQELKVPKVKETKEQAPVNPKKDFDEFTQLKLKEKERKRKKQDAIFQQKLEESKSKV